MFASTTWPPLVCIAWTLIHAIWQGVVVWLVYRLARASIREAAVRCHVGHACLFIFVAAQCLTFTHLLQAEPTPQAPIADMTFVRLAEANAAAHRLPLPRIEPAVRIGTWISAHENYLQLLAMAWGVGLLLQITRTLGAFYLLQRHLDACRQIDSDLNARLVVLSERMGLHRAVRFLESELVHSPATARWLKPVVLIPAATILSLPPQQLEALILHELAHIRRWDYATNILRTFVSATYFFHPLVRDISRRVAEDAEVATDALAATAVGDGQAYAESLIALADLRRTQALLIPSNGGDLRGRILSLLGRQSPPVAGLRSRASLTGTLLSGVVGTLVLMHATTWASNARATMNKLEHSSLTETVVKAFSKDDHNEIFTQAVAQAIAELNDEQFITHATASTLTDQVLSGVDPDVLYRRICATPGHVDFKVVREIPFGPFGDNGDRIDLINELIRHARAAADPKHGSRVARATLVFASLMAPSDSARAATRLLQDTSFIAMLRLSEQEYRLFLLMAAVNNERLARVGKIIATERRCDGKTSDADVEAFASDLPHLPGMQVTLPALSPQFQQRVGKVLRRDLASYRAGSVRFVLERASPATRPAK